MKILITGGTGFVGKTLVPYFFSHSLTDICLLVRNRNKAICLFPNIDLKIISTSENEWIEEVINYSPDIVLHMATFFTGKSDDASIKKLIVQISCSRPNCLKQFLILLVVLLLISVHLPNTYMVPVNICQTIFIRLLRVLCIPL